MLIQSRTLQGRILAGAVLLALTAVPRPIARTGCRNLVVGSGQKLARSGGFVAGRSNVLSARDASVPGGWPNQARGPASAVPTAPRTRRSAIEPAAAAPEDPPGESFPR